MGTKFTEVMKMTDGFRRAPSTAHQETPMPPSSNVAASKKESDRQYQIDRNLITFHEPQSFESEQFKHLRTHVMFPSSGLAPRCIMITSIAPGDGKSFVAANLAVSIAQGIQEHVLLMDCDLRKACQHKIFGFDRCEGLQGYLTHQIELANLLLKTDIEKLSLLPAGKRPNNPSELLSSQRMFQLIKEVRDRYNDRFIIIDSPPPALTSESTAISHQVDGIIVVVEAGKNKKEQVASLLGSFGKNKVIGTVFNRYDLRDSSYSKKYKGYVSYYR